MFVVMKLIRNFMEKKLDRMKKKFSNFYNNILFDILDSTNTTQFTIIKPTKYQDVKNTARKAARKEGLFLGASAAAILHIALEKAKSLGLGRRIVAVLPDDGMKYLSTDLYNGEDNNPEN